MDFKEIDLTKHDSRPLLYSTTFEARLFHTKGTVIRDLRDVFFSLTIHCLFDAVLMFSAAVFTRCGLLICSEGPLRP